MTTLLDFRSNVRAYLNERQGDKFKHDRSQTIGASIIGACARKAWALTHMKRGDFPPGTRDANGYAARGDDVEAHFVVPFLRATISKQMPSASLIWAGPGEQRTIEVLPWRLSSTPDGIVTNADLGCLRGYGIGNLLEPNFPVEVKSYDPLVDKDSLPKQQHVDQLNAQIGLINHLGETPAKFGLIFYVNASNYEDFVVVPHLYDRFAFERQIQRALSIYQAPSMDVLRPEGMIAGGRECQTCPVRDKCQGYSKHVPTGVYKFEKMPKGLQVEVMGAIGTLDNIDRQLKDLTSRKSGTVARLKELMAQGQTNTVEGKLKDGRIFRAKWSRLRPQMRLDSKSVVEFVSKNFPDSTAKELGLMKETKGSENLRVKIIDPEDFDPEEFAKQEDEPTETVETETT